MNLICIQLMFLYSLNVSVFVGLIKDYFPYQNVGVASTKLRTEDWLSRGGRIQEVGTVGLGTLDSSNAPHCSLGHRPHAY